MTEPINFETRVEIEGGESFEPPLYSKPGKLIVKVGPTDSTVYKHNYEVLYYEEDTSVFWINEGMGFDHWFDTYCAFEEPGTYLVEGIIGHYYRGDGWATDDDETWEYSQISPTTLQTLG